MNFRIARGLAYGILLWIAGFMWGMVVFMTPSLKNVPLWRTVATCLVIGSGTVAFYWANVLFGTGSE